MFECDFSQAVEPCVRVQSELTYFICIRWISAADLCLSSTIGQSDVRSEDIFFVKLGYQDGRKC